MPKSEAQKRASQKYRQSEKGKERKKQSRLNVSFDISTVSESNIIEALSQLSIPKGQYAKQALIEKLIRDGFLTN